MIKYIHKLTGLLLALILAVGIMPVSAWALDGDDTTIDISALGDADIGDNTTAWQYNNVPDTDDGSLTIRQEGITLTGTNGGLAVFVEATTITLENAHITAMSGMIALEKDDSGLTRNLTVTLIGDSTLTGSANAGVLVSGEELLTFAGGGTLTANGGGSAAGISAEGGMVITGENTSVIANGGTDFLGGSGVDTSALTVDATCALTATGGEGLVGEGGTGIVSSGAITNNGTITATGGNGTDTGGDGGAGIVSSGAITNNGTITATGGESQKRDGGAGIVTSDAITNNGTITATGGMSEDGGGGAGICSGSDIALINNSGGVITSTGGDCQGGSGGGSAILAEGNSIAISNSGSITFTGGNGSNGAPGGSGMVAINGGSITATHIGAGQTGVIPGEPGGTQTSGNVTIIAATPQPDRDPQPTHTDDDEPVEPVKAGISLTGGTLTGGGIWTGGDLAFTATADGLTPAQLKQVFVDLDELDRAHYTVKSGSVIVTLKESYLQTLAPGEHVITLEFTEHIGSGIFKVAAKAVTLPAPIPEATGNANFNPNTGL